MLSSPKAETMYQLIRDRAKYSQITPEIQPLGPSPQSTKSTLKGSSTDNAEGPVSLKVAPSPNITKASPS